MADEKRYRYSEIFHSFQGEGHYTGVSSAWIRFFLCNLQCDGFGQKQPTKPETWILPYQDFDVSTITRVEDLPVWEYGCDSSYTWAKKYRHLAHNDTAAEICDKLEDVLKHPSNPKGLFWHPKTGQRHHMCFTGGEPMLNQPAMVEIIEEFERRGNRPNFVTVETNGTKPLKGDAISSMIDKHYNLFYERGRWEWFWSCSPKLWTTAGEKSEKAIKPEVVREYAAISDRGQLKFVVNGTDESWEELEQHISAFRQAGVHWPIWIMYVGATKEEQEDGRIGDVAMEAMKRGYYFSGRLHCHVFGNQIGT